MSLTWLTISCELPYIYNFLILRRIATFRHKINASYSTILLVHSNLSLYAMGITSFEGETKMILALALYVHLEPSKYSVQV